MTPGRLVAVLLLLAGGAGWWFFVRGGGDAANGAAARLGVTWRGKYQGTMSLPVTLNWCPVTRVGVLEAVSGDSGMAIVLYERDSLVGGPHPVVSPETAAAATRPGASVAMRWVRTLPDTALAGYRSESGTVRLQLAGGKASGDLSARLRSVGGTDTLVVQGTFTGVPVVTTAKGCT